MMAETHTQLFTIGYGTHSLESFLDALVRHGVTAVADVRSEPYSAYKPEFNREPLRNFLHSKGVAYVYLGDSLGARNMESGVVVEGRVDFDRVARSPFFQEGLNRLRQGLEKYRVALMCAEKDPMGCHRTILICRNLRNEYDILHILADGNLESQRQLEVRLVKLFRLDQRTLPGLDDGSHTPLEEAYRKQARAIAYDMNAKETTESNV